MGNPPLPLHELERNELTVLPSFDRHAAWRLGCIMRDRALDQRAPVAIDVRAASGAVLFHSSLPGATADNDEWIRRKYALAVRFESSSALISARLTAAGVDAAAMGWLDPAVYALSGGAVPIRVSNAGIVAIATVSGLASDEDHRLVTSAIDALRSELDTSAAVVEK